MSTNRIKKKKISHVTPRAETEYYTFVIIIILIKILFCFINFIKKLFFILKLNFFFPVYNPFKNFFIHFFFLNY